MHTNETQANQILNHLTKGNKITALEALNDFKCFRLAPRILELKKKGYPIVKEMVKTRTGKIVAEYSLPAGTIVVDNLQKAS